MVEVDRLLSASRDPLIDQDPAAIYSRIVAYSKGNLSVLPALWERNIRYVIDNFVPKKFSAGVDFFFFFFTIGKFISFLARYI